MLAIFNKIIDGLRPRDATNYYPHEPRVYSYRRDSSKRLLEKQKLLIEDAFEVLCFKEEDFKQYAEPLIEWLASYVLLLPASEYYHHTLPGSLFYHSLQTANYAAYFASHDPRFKFYETPQDRTSAMVFIPFAAWVSGLTHDISKAGTDMMIKCRDSKSKGRVDDWKPDIESLDSWCIRNSVTAYTAIFSKDRDPTLSNNLRSFYLNQATQLIPKSWKYFSRFNAILNSSLDHRRPLYSVVTKADERSLFLDKNRFHKEPSIMRESAIFMSALQDMDSRNGSSEDFDLYYRSEWGIHIPYPNGVRRIVEYISSRYSDFDRIQVIESNNIDIWINRLGHSFSLLQPHYQDQTFARNQQIHPFVYPLSIEHRGAQITVNCITIKQFGFILANGEKNTVSSASFFEPEATQIAPLSIDATSQEDTNLVPQTSEQEEIVGANNKVEQKRKKATTKKLTSNEGNLQTNHVDNQEQAALPKFIDPELTASLKSIEFDISDSELDCKENNEGEVSSEESYDHEKLDELQPSDLNEHEGPNITQLPEQNTTKSENESDLSQVVPAADSEQRVYCLANLSELASENNEPLIADYFENISDNHPLKSYLSNTPSLSNDLLMCLMLMFLYEMLENKTFDFNQIHADHPRIAIYLKKDGLYFNPHKFAMKVEFHIVKSIHIPGITSRISNYAKGFKNIELDSHSFGTFISDEVIRISQHCAAPLLTPMKNIIQSYIREGKVTFNES